MLLFLLISFVLFVPFVDNHVFSVYGSGGGTV